MIPGRHDGMAAFAGPGDLVTLVRNHEIAGTVNAYKVDGNTYDTKTGGGTTTIVVNKFGEVERSWASLTGTQNNCSGGAMPWGSWISCEETVNGPDVADDFTRNQANNPPGDTAKPDGSDPYEYFQNPGLQERHGYIFEVPSDGVSSGEPITSAGRFSHESVAYDPRNNDLYLTEDNFGFPSGFYRYRPSKRADKNGRLDNKGQLQMLAVKHQPNANLAAEQPVGATLRGRVGEHRPAGLRRRSAGQRRATDDERRGDHLRRAAGLQPEEGCAPTSPGSRAPCTTTA